jgi:hypothetical protein
MAPFGPLATIESNAGFSAPRSIMMRSRATAISRSVVPGRSSDRTASNVRSVIAQASRSKASSASSFTLLSRSTAGPSGTSSSPCPASSSYASTVTSWASKPSRRTPSRAAHSTRDVATCRSTTDSSSGQTLRAVPA